jgi:hypothetical protein
MLNNANVNQENGFLRVYIIKIKNKQLVKFQIIYPD